MIAGVRYIAEIPMRFRRVTQSGSYVPQIDGMRFLAIVPVLVWHACIRASKTHPEIRIQDAVAWIPHGHVGVELFFFISGYIIAFPFLAGRAPSMKHFFLRRLYRLEPPYFVALLVAFAGLTLTAYKPADALSFDASIPLWQSLLASFGYVHWLVFGAPSTILPPVWSLEVEIQFYLLSPLLLLLYLRIGSLPARLIFGLTICAAWLVLGCWLDSLYGQFGVHRLTLAKYGASFLLGIVVCDYALAARPFEQLAQRKYDIAFVLGIILLLAAGPFRFEERTDFAFGLARDGLKLLAVLMIYLGTARGVFGRKAMGAPLIALIGGMCYSIYLTHLIVMQVGHIILARVMPPMPLALADLVWVLLLGPASIVAGFVFYVLIERPCMAPNWPEKLAAALRRNGDVGAKA